MRVCVIQYVFVCVRRYVLCLGALLYLVSRVQTAVWVLRLSICTVQREISPHGQEVAGCQPVGR